MSPLFVLSPPLQFPPLSLRYSLKHCYVIFLSLPLFFFTFHRLSSTRCNCFHGFFPTISACCTERCSTAQYGEDLVTWCNVTNIWGRSCNVILKLNFNRIQSQIYRRNGAFWLSFIPHSPRMTNSSNMPLQHMQR